MSADPIDRNEAARILEVSVSRVKQLVAERRLPAEFIAGRWVFSRAAVRKFKRVPRIRTGRPKVAS